MIKNLLEKISKVKVDAVYDLPAECAIELINHSRGNKFILVYNSFLAGYMQGHKAAKAELNKK